MKAKKQQKKEPESPGATHRANRFLPAVLERSSIRNAAIRAAQGGVSGYRSSPSLLTRVSAQTSAWHVGLLRESKLSFALSHGSPPTHSL